MEMVSVEGLDEKAFVTGMMKENDYNKAAEELGNIINMIRLD